MKKNHNSIAAIKENFSFNQFVQVCTTTELKPNEKSQHLGQHCYEAARLYTVLLKNNDVLV